MVTTQKYHHGDLRNALLDAALEILQAKGSSGISLRGIAKKAGVSQTALYSHFVDKNTLLIEVAALGFGKLSVALALAKGDSNSLQKTQILNALGIAYVNFAIRNKTLFRLMFGNDLSDLPKSVHYEHAARNAYSILQDCIESTGGTNTQTRAAWSMVHGMATLIVDNKLAVQSNIEDELTEILNCFNF